MPTHPTPEIPCRRFASRRVALLAPPIALALLAGCAFPTALAPGTPEAEVVSRYGRPAEVYPLPADARRLAYPIGALNQQTWLIDVDAQGRVTRVDQVLTAAHFGRIKVGADDTSLVRREFGPPREIQTYAASGLTAWLYPYKESGVWNSEMAVYFDKAGIVRKVESGPDPRFIRGGNKND